MMGPVHGFFVDDHSRLSELLDRVTYRSVQIDLAAYAEFRVGLFSSQ